MAGTRTTSRRIARVFGLLALLAVFVGAGPARPAAAHAELLTSDPSGGSVFETAPAQVTLAFTEAVEISLGAVELFDGTGSAIELDDATHPGGDGTQVVVALPSLGDGSYVVSWKVLSADSHPVSGAFTFQVGDLSTLEAGVLGEVAAGASTNEQAGALLDVLRVLLIAGSAAVGGLLALQGFGVVEWNARHRRVASAGAVVGGLAGWLMIPVEVAYVDGRSVSAALVDPSAWRLLLETDIGVAWAVRAIALYLGGFALIATVRYHRAGWWRSALVAELVVIAGAFAYGGHGATGRWMLFGIGTTIVHVIAMMIWIGGLVGLLLGLDQLGPVAVRRWSSIAFVAATAVIVSGTVQAVRQLPELSSLWDSDYGRLLLAKVCAVALVVVFAAAARRMVRTDGERGAMRRTIGTELLFAAAVIAITGALDGRQSEHRRGRRPVRADAGQRRLHRIGDGRSGEGRGEPAPPLPLQPGRELVAAGLGQRDDRRPGQRDRTAGGGGGRRRGEPLPVDRSHRSVPVGVDTDDPRRLRHVHRGRLLRRGPDPMSDPTNEPPLGSSAATPGVYYTGKYWNNRPEVVEHLNRRATDSPAVRWWEHLVAWHGGPFRRVLALNCGNGWVEQELLEGGVASSAVGLDIDPALLHGASVAAERRGLDVTYLQVDINSFPFDPAEIGEVDLVVNYAAAHHISHIDAVFRRIASLLRPDGVFVSWDYTGPHRNQYAAAQWEALHRLNLELPVELRKQLTYPHLPTMLATDPSEAVHSDLVLPTMRRYFDLVHLRHLGGGLAYELLTFNDSFFDPSLDTGGEVARILAADQAYTDVDPAQRSLFTYAIARPAAVMPATTELVRWTEDELAREAAAAATGGRYGDDTLIGSLTTRIEQLERAVAAAEAGRPPERPAGRAELAGRRLDEAIRRWRGALRARSGSLRRGRRN